MGHFPDSYKYWQVIDIQANTAWETKSGEKTFVRGLPGVRVLTRLCSFPINEFPAGCGPTEQVEDEFLASRGEFAVSDYVVFEGAHTCRRPTEEECLHIKEKEQRIKT